MERDTAYEAASLLAGCFPSGSWYLQELEDTTYVVTGWYRGSDYRIDLSGNSKTYPWSVMRTMPALGTSPEAVALAYGITPIDALATASQAAQA